MIVNWPPVTYQVLGRNTGGSSLTTVTIGVRAVAPTSLYMSGGAMEIHTVGTRVKTNAPKWNGDPVNTWVVEPELPPGGCCRRPTVVC